MGYIHYASVDEIFTPYIYSGSSIQYEINKLVFRKNCIREYSISFADIIRTPTNVQLFEKFNVIGYDGSKYTIVADEQFKQMNTLLVSSHYSYLRLFPFFENRKYQFYFGLTSDLFAVFRSSISNPELLSFCFNPALAYKLNINSRFNLRIESSLTLFGINLRKPYSGAEAQLVDNYSYKYYYDYTIHNFTVDFLNNYFKQTNLIAVQSRITNRLYFTLAYKFQYLSLKTPRKLTSTTDIINTGLSLRFK